MPSITKSTARPVARKRVGDAFERSVTVLRKFRTSSSAEEMERIALRLEDAITPIGISSERSELLAMLTGGETLSTHRRMELETAGIARYFKRRRELLKNTISAPEVARLLGITRQTPHDRVKAGTMLAVRDRGGLRFPSWQFDAEGPDGVLAGFSEVVKALDVSALEKVSWFVRSNPYLAGRTPLEALKVGETQQLVSIARGVGAN
jgi:hypothetical protein